jgi:hypothetical protein
MSGSECIYCGVVGTHKFPKDHVVPSAFGRFKNNLTLDCVCGPCNSYFGRELELFLTQDSIEALLRVRYGVKTKSGSKQIGRSRLTFRVISAGDCYGARITAERESSGTSLRGKPMPQVAFRKFDEAQWHWFLEAELEKSECWQRFLVDAETLIVGPPGEDLSRLCRTLERFGVVFKKTGTPERIGGLNQMHAEPMLDDILYRGVGKIAFNFLAYVTGGRFTGREEFDEMRDYIRSGVMPPWTPVSIVKASQATEDDGISRRTGGHEIVLWRDEASRVICQVALFNHLTYLIVLSRGNSVWYPLKDGRYFDLDTLRVRTLT